MSNSAKNSKMLANDDDAEAAGGAAPSLTVAAAPAAAAEAMTASHDASQSDCDGSYICDCRLWYVPILLLFSVLACNI